MTLDELIERLHYLRKNGAPGSAEVNLYQQTWIERFEIAEPDDVEFFEGTIDINFS